MFIRCSVFRAVPNAAAPVGVALLFCTLSTGCQSAAAHYEHQAQAVGQLAARETRSYIERDPAFLDRPDDRSRSLQQVDWLERMTTDPDVARLGAIEQAWSAVAPLFQTYVRDDPALDPAHKQALLAMASSFDLLNRAERGRQSAWRRVQGTRYRLEPN